ncbi:5-formyltetrahydrofolate cyclo-ligase [Jannaschia pohangensis]|uniref:5-formyltetrahydrofolate cyclo-ligase n=1 Tax=Jannaschia pohangensis TaxID=390807 RepID=A0A1I3S372_9RHOB|nr:5-formyltetrahydrofolate cyclo-ligase [Jannaschia pohangensis]
MRKACLAAREGVGREARAAAATRLFARLCALRGKTIAGYLPIGSEADPRGAMRVLCADNRICVPVVTGRGAPLRFRDWTPGCAVAPGDFGVMVPTEGGWRMPDVVIVPLVGFDGRGNRLGYGGGFYDRTLAGLTDTLIVGFALDAQRLPDLPVEPTDVALPWIVTESGVFGTGDAV